MSWCTLRAAMVGAADLPTEDSPSPCPTGRARGSRPPLLHYVTHFGLDNTQTRQGAGGGLWAPAAILSSCLSQRRGFFLSQFTSGEDRFCTETAVKKQREQQDQPRSPPRRSHEAWSCSVPCRYHSPQHEEPGLRGKHIARETIRLVHHAFSCHFYSLGIL